MKGVWMSMKKKVYELNIDQFANTFFNLIPIGMVIVDSDTKIKVVNKALTDMMGGNDIIEIGKRFGDGFRCIGSLMGGCGFGEACIMCAIRGNIIKALKTDQTYDNIILEHEFMLNEREVTPWYKMSFVPLSIQEEKYVMITVDDVTELKVG